MIVYTKRLFPACLLLASLLLAAKPIETCSANAAEAIMPGTIYQTELRVIRSSMPGPVVLVLGGVHGDEPAGSLAAAQISKFSIKRGVLLVIPRVNTLALTQQSRTLPHIGDVNRAYPGRADGSPAEQIAFAIDRLIADYGVSMLVDLHEGRAFHRLDTSSVGQTILFASNDRSTLLAMDMADWINRQIKEPHKRFSLVAHPVPHSASHYAAEHYRIAAFTLETAAAQPLADRVEQHIALVTFLLQQEGLL